MKTIFIVLRKELLDTLRDKRTLISAVLLPAVIIPVLILGVTKLQQRLMSGEKNKQLKIALINTPSAMKDQLKDDHFQLLENYTLSTGKQAVQNDSLDAIIEFPPDFTMTMQKMKTCKLNLYYKSTNLLLYARVSEKIEGIKSTLLTERIQQFDISAEALTPIAISKIDVASPKEQIGKMVGGFLPYIFIIFCFMGCMAPALDIIVGEKERGTIETLLTVPASHFQILMGKIICIALVGLTASLMTIFGMFTCMKFLSGIPQDFVDSINDILSVKFVLMLFAMLLPLSLFFAGTLSAIVIRTKSVKEAQSIVVPLNFMVLIPAMIALMPGIELNWKTVWFPILNIALATKQIIAGTIEISQYAVILLSLILLALLAAFASYKQFFKEGMVLK